MRGNTAEEEQLFICFLSRFCTFSCCDVHTNIVTLNRTSPWSRKIIFINFSGTRSRIVFLSLVHDLLYLFFSHIWTHMVCRQGSRAKHEPFYILLPVNAALPHWLAVIPAKDVVTLQLYWGSISTALLSI